MKNNFEAEPSDLDQLLFDIEQYDSDHNKGTWMGRGLSSFILGMLPIENESNEIDAPNPDLQRLHENIQSNLTLKDLVDRHRETLRNMGLELESPNKGGDFDEQETYAVGEIRINIEDKDKFIGFLFSLENLSSQQKKLLVLVVNRLVLQVQTEYSLDEPDDRLLEMLSGLRSIVSEYERLGMHDEISIFKNYLQYTNGSLREYVLSLKNHIFEPIGEGFNLSTYQQDSSPKSYMERWDNQVFETLDAIKKNPKAGDLYDRVYTYAIEAIHFAETDPTLDKYEVKNPDYVLNIRDAIQRVKQKLLLKSPLVKVSEEI